MIRAIALLAVLAASLSTGGCIAAPATGVQRIGPAEVRVFPRTRLSGWRFGGLSGLAWDGESDHLLAVSDRGQVFALPMDVTQAPWHVARMALRRRVDDPEAIQRTPEGGWAVAFEGGSMIGFFPGDATALRRAPARAIPLARHAGPVGGAGIESLALLDFGRLLAIREGGDGDDRPAWIVDGDVVEPRSYRSSDGFSPVDALMLPSGDVLVLERRFNGLSTPFFSSRLAVLPARLIDRPGATLAPSRRIDLADVLPSENWEGMTLTLHEAEHTLWLVSDDNLQWPQRTLLARIPLAWVTEAAGAD